MDRDDFVQKTNIAPRLSSSLDLFGTGDTVLIAGANRYYGRSMLTYALYEAQNAGMEHCYYFCSLDPSENDWDGVKDFEGIDSLKTPYNDELSFALQQQVMQSTWRLQYVHREGYDEVRSRTKYRNPNSASQARIRTFDNGGRSSNDRYHSRSATANLGNWPPQLMLLPAHSHGSKVKAIRRKIRAMPSLIRTPSWIQTKCGTTAK